LTTAVNVLEQFFVVTAVATRVFVLGIFFSF
jgi:hypothetical protein